MIAPLFLARRFILSTNNRTLKIMLRVCFFSIFVGSCAFALTLAIMQGFEEATFIKMKGIHADAYLQAPTQQSFDLTTIAALLKKEFPDIQHVTGYRYGQGLLVSEEDTEDISLSASILVGIYPEHEQEVTALHASIFPSNSLAAILNTNHIVIGKSRARALNLAVGDTAWLLVPTEIKGQSVQFEKHVVVIGGLLSTGFEEIDERIIYLDARFLESLTEAPLTQIGLHIAPSAEVGSLVNAIKNRFNVSAYPWTEINPAVFSALTLEKYAMGFVAFLIAFVASMNVVALLFMFVTHKKNDIAILRAMGMNSRSLYIGFIALALYVVMSATILGLLVAALSAWVLNTYKIISLPDVYYISHVPAIFSWNLAGFILIVAIILALFACWIALARLGRQSIGWLLTTMHE